MALLTHRDPLVVGAALARWITARTGVHEVRVINAEHPSVGYSSETVLVDLAWSGDGDDRGEQTHELVVRLAPPTAGLFPDYDLARQTMAQIAATTAYICSAVYRTIRVSRWSGIGRSTPHSPAGGFKTREVLTCMVGRTRQGACRYHEKALCARQ